MANLVVSGSYTQTVTTATDVLVEAGASITCTYPAALQITGDGHTVTLAGGTLSCSSIRNAALLFGGDAYWVNDTYGPHYDGTVNFTGSDVTLYSAIGNCITAAGIVGKNLTVNFTGSASGSKNIRIEATNRTSLAGNYAIGMAADENLTLNGVFGGTIDCHFDFRSVPSDKNRTATLWGLKAGTTLTVNGDLSGSIVLSAVGTSSAASVSYGLYGKNGVTVTGEISGLVAATAEKSAYAVYSNKGGCNISVSGTLFAGTSTAANTTAALRSKLADFSANRTELLSLAEGQYAVYAGDTSLIKFNTGALVIGDIGLTDAESRIVINGDARWFGNLKARQDARIYINLTSASLSGSRLNGIEWTSKHFLFVDASTVGSGEYILAEGSNFTLTPRVSVATRPAQNGIQGGHVIPVGESYTDHYGVTCRVSLVTTGSTERLILTVENATATIAAPVITADITLPTRGNVVLTATCDPTCVRTEYSFDGESWQSCPGSITVVDNGTFYFRGIDAAGVYSAVGTYAVSNIDRIAPELPVIRYNDAPTNGNVTVTAEFSADSAVRKYSLNNRVWRDYEGAVTLTENGSVRFYAEDAAGNRSATVVCRVSNIDRIAPGAVTSASATLQEYAAAFTWNAATDNVGVAGYYLDLNGVIHTVTGTATRLTDLDCGNYSWRVAAFDTAGNRGDWSAAQSFTVLDVTPPVVNRLIASGGYLSWSGSDKGTGIASYEVQYRTAGGGWVTWLAATTETRKRFELQGLFDFRVRSVDRAGNVGAWLTREKVEPNTISEEFDGRYIGGSAPLPIEPPLAAGRYRFTDVTFPAGFSGKLTVVDAAGKKVFSTAIRKGVPAAGTGLIPGGSGYGVVLSGKTSAEYSFRLVSEELFSLANQAADDDWRATGVPVLNCVSGSGITGEWVGFGDAVDYRKLKVGVSGRFDFTLQKLENAARLTVWQDTGGRLKKVKSLNAAGTGGMLAGLLLDASKSYYLSVEAPKAARGLNTGYDLAVSGIRFERANQVADGDWLAAGLPVLNCAPGSGISGEWVGFGDAVDYRKLKVTVSGQYDFTLKGLENAARLTVWLDAGNGKLKKVKNLNVSGASETLGGLLLDASKSYYLSVQAPKAARGVNTGYDLAVSGTLFNHAKNRVANDFWGDSGVETLDLARGIRDEWVGFGDAADFYRFDLAAAGAGEYGFRLTGLADEKFAKLTLYRVEEGRLAAVKLDRDGLAYLGEGEYTLKIASADSGKGKKNTAYGVAVSLPAAQSSGLLSAQIA